MQSARNHLKIKSEMNPLSFKPFKGHIARRLSHKKAASISSYKQEYFF